MALAARRGAVVLVRRARRIRGKIPRKKRRLHGLIPASPSSTLTILKKVLKVKAPVTSCILHRPSIVYILS